MTDSHWDRLPDNIKGLIYQFDSTAKTKFNEVLKELTIKFYKAKRRMCRSQYRPSNDMNYLYTLLNFPMRRKSKNSIYYTKKNRLVVIGWCSIQPVEHNNRAEIIQRERMSKHWKQVENWTRLVSDYRAYLNRIWCICNRKMLKITMKMLK